MHIDFLQAVENFLEKTGLEPSKLGLYAVSNPSLVSRLRKGKSCNLSTANRVLAFIKANQHQDFRGATPVMVARITPKKQKEPTHHAHTA
jgi:hypothetical protein